MGHEVFIFGCKIMILLMELLRKHVKPSKERGPSSRGNQPSWKGRLLSAASTLASSTSFAREP
ncbi:hypothetical protein CPAR01_14333 [Colletotrichum paranaense]|uniref:Uncharacterized protein n=2 Tax=Colletotrichum acutatum species complex TaxID=2707335 RepID=A0AAI9UQ44_9PEZI|nr:uncharacterized protein CPAR01_14333 [Colletotrichum paranaense]KAK1461529.1 hypothetical protein CMEL01_14483 [Colletotrichum melonis]KAK1522790.1 hypothetical protein CPAR01_14333 [Colletotrichum paranaense]